MFGCRREGITPLTNTACTLDMYVRTFFVIILRTYVRMSVRSTVLYAVDKGLHEKG